MPEENNSVAGLGTCGQCLRWKKCDKNAYPEQFGLGKCEIVPLFTDSTEFDESTDCWVQVYKEKAKGLKAFVGGDMSNEAEFLTAPDFGCVQFEKGPASTK